ncbi:hypothetical protein MLD38_014976 [Melastoma candidum]|uniref:Uncharacterized protein n=1 Tax=Melastoma candidum TaxID=119954 RepID=A0ACB9RF53_9MYRT|nr:hypothetical protein MLD38_014976 [Melastoma candidum]
MNLSPFKLDVDELINEFAENGSTTLADMKRVWLSRKFSFIYQASPSYNLTFFMQTLYSKSIGHIVGSESLPHQLGGLYCLYCLYETQPFRPPFRIYISLSEMRSLKNLVVIAKQRGIQLVCPLVKRMLEEGMFLFGSLDVNEGSLAEKVNQLTELQNARVQLAYKKLFANTRIEHFLQMNLNEEIDLDAIKKTSADYLNAKRLAIEGAGAMADVQNIEHIATDKNPIGDTLEGITDAWDSQKKAFNQQIGHYQIPGDSQFKQLQLEHQPQNEDPQEGDNGDDFDLELEQLLSRS